MAGCGKLLPAALADNQTSMTIILTDRSWHSTDLQLTLYETCRPTAENYDASQLRRIDSLPC